MHKSFLLAFLAFIFCAPSAYSAVLLEKISYAGFTLPEYAVSKKCTIHDDGRMVIQHQLGGMSSQSTVKLRLTLSTIKSTIVLASNGKIKSENMAVDSPTYIYKGFQSLADGSVKSVLLYEENGGSGIKRTNSSRFALTLSNFIDLNCGDTFHD